MSRKTLYKICFVNQGKIYEIFARVVAPSDIMGFVEVEQLVFGETSSIVVDPSEEKLQHEFAGVKRTHIPMHSVIRIDEVEKLGTARITAIDKNAPTVTHLYPAYPARNRKPDNNQ